MAFLFGFLLLTFVQVGLSWLANMPRTTNYPCFFDNLVGWLLFFGIAAGMFLTATGTILSILCLYGIQYGPDVSGASRILGCHRCYVRCRFILDHSPWGFFLVELHEMAEALSNILGRLLSR